MSTTIILGLFGLVVLTLVIMLVLAWRIGRLAERVRTSSRNEIHHPSGQRGHIVIAPVVTLVRRKA
jgi:hypothetical protein